MWKLLFLALGLTSAVTSADARPRGAPYPNQIAYNIVSDGGASCNGNVQTVTRTVSISSGTSGLNTSADTFSPGDVNKVILVPGTTFNPGDEAFTTITGFTDARNITVAGTATATLAGAVTNITFGSDDAAAFRTFNTWARANQGVSQVVLTVPAGSCWFGSGGQIFGLSNAFTNGINNLIVEGTGATLNGVNGSGFFLGTSGVCQAGLASDSGCSARLQTVSAGSSTVTLTAASLSAGYISRFVANQWVMIGGLDIQNTFQSPYGYPPNQTYFEWRQITNVNEGTGVITLDRPLTNSYLSTWPNYNAGNNFEADSGGPATIWTVGGSVASGRNTWNTTIEYRGLTISNTQITYSLGRNITYRNVTWTGSYCGIPSQNEAWTVIDSDMSTCTMEVDKLIGTMTLDNVAINQVQFQSNSTNSLVTRNGTTITSLVGTAKSAAMTDTSIVGFTPGSYGYGNGAGPLVCTRCDITTLNLVNAGVGDFGSSPWPYTMAGGVISLPIGADLGAGRPDRWASPIDLVMPFSTGTYASIGNFKILGVSGGTWPAVDNQTLSTTITIANGSTNLNVPSGPFVSGDVGKTISVGGAAGISAPTPLLGWITAFVDAQNVTLAYPATRAVSAATQTIQWGTANVAIQTNQAGGFPSTASLGGGTVTFTRNGRENALGAQRFTCDACTGDAALVAMNIQQGATPLAPMATYSKRTYAPTSAQGSLGSMWGIGKLVSLTIDVTQAYSGAGAATLQPTAQFSQTLVKQGTMAPFTWAPVINLKQTGVRVITPLGVTCDSVPGPCSGDTINSTDGYPGDANSWSAVGISPFMGSTLGVGTQPQFSITIQTDQTP